MITEGCYSAQNMIVRAINLLIDGWRLLKIEHKIENPNFGEGIEFSYIISHILTFRLDLGRKAGHTTYIGIHAKEGDLVFLNNQQKIFNFNFSFSTPAKTYNIRSLTTNYNNNNGMLFEFENLVLDENATVWIDDYSYLSVSDKDTLNYIINKVVKSYNNSVIKLG
jgi:hypothetical protein